MNIPINFSIFFYKINYFQSTVFSLLTSSDWSYSSEDRFFSSQSASVFAIQSGQIENEQGWQW